MAYYLKGKANSFLPQKSRGEGCDFRLMPLTPPSKRNLKRLNRESFICLFLVAACVRLNTRFGTFGVGLDNLFLLSYARLRCIDCCFVYV